MAMTPKRRRLALVFIPTALIAMTGVGSIVGKLAQASSPRLTTPYTQCPYLPYVNNKAFMVSIQNSLYDASSSVNYAQVFNPSGTSLGYWYVDNQATASATINGTSVYVITVVFNTTLQSSPPSAANPKPRVSKDLKATPIPVGATLCINTNVTGDACATMPPITLNVVNVNPCP